MYCKQASVLYCNLLFIDLTINVTENNYLREKSLIAP